MGKLRRSYQKHAARISRYIFEMRLPPGARLPSELELSKICGTSRTTVREALVALEVAGELRRHVGSGAYVKETSKSSDLSLTAGPRPVELLRARLLIEGEVAANAALYATATDLIRIEKALQEMRRLILGKDDVRMADRRFHVAVGEATRNNVLSNIVDGLWTGMTAPMYFRFSQQEDLEQHQTAALGDHEAIFEAIAARNPDQARRAMRLHVQKMEVYLECNKTLEFSVPEEKYKTRSSKVERTFKVQLIQEANPILRKMA